MFLKKALAVSILTAPVALTGCGGGDATTDTTSNKASLTVAMTDGPVDAATAVVIEVTGIAVKPVDGEVITVEFDTPKSIDLLQLQGSDATNLVQELALEAGDYAWVRVFINATDDGVLDSYMAFEDGTTVELDMPFGAEEGLKVARRFTLIEGEDATFTIDFDLRKSLFQRERHLPTTLRPSMRMVPNHRSGHLHGSLDAMLVSDLCADPAAEIGAVYVYGGSDATPTDVNGGEADPIASALVKMTDEGEYRYRIGFLEAGDYTVAYTCDAASDNPDEVNELQFAMLEPITIAEREEHEHGFEMDAPRKDWKETVCDEVLVEETEEGSEEAAVEETEGESEAAEVTSEKPFFHRLRDWCAGEPREWLPRDHEHNEEDGDWERPELELPELPELPEFPIEEGEEGEWERPEFPNVDGEDLLPEERPEYPRPVRGDHDADDAEEAADDSEETETEEAVEAETV